MTYAANDVVLGRHLDKAEKRIKREIGKIAAGGASVAVFTGATAVDGTSGLVPAPLAGDNGKFLRGDGTWATVGGGSSSDGYVIGSKVSGVEGGFWQDIYNGVPILKLRHGDYEYNFAYDGLTFIGGASSALVNTTPNTYVLGTASVSNDGGIWYEANNDVPTLKLHNGSFNYGFNYDTVTYKGDNSHLVAYLPFDASTTADACGNEWTATGNVSIDTTTKKFGTASLKITGSDKHGLSAGSIIDINADKWTVDVWFYRDTTSSRLNLGIENSHSETTSGIACMYDGLFLNNVGRVSNALNRDVFPVGEWAHVAIVRNGSNLLLFKNGQLVDTIALTDDFLTGGGIELGCVAGYAGYDAHYDSLRFFEGVALWVSDFTPPTAEDYL